MSKTKANSGVVRFQNAGHILFTVVFALVMTLMLLAVLFGAQVYRMALDTDVRSGQIRSVEGFIASTFRASDTYGSLGLTQGPEGLALCLYEDEEKYTVTYIYLYEGYLVQENTVSGYALEPESATKIAPLSSFEVEVDGNTAKIATSEGTFVNTLRSRGDS